MLQGAHLRQPHGPEVHQLKQSLVEAIKVHGGLAGHLFSPLRGRRQFQLLLRKQQLLVTICKQQLTISNQCRNMPNPPQPGRYAGDHHLNPAMPSDETRILMQNIDEARADGEQGHVHALRNVQRPL